MTIAYSHGNEFMAAPNMWESLSLGHLAEKHRFKFHVHVNRLKLKKLPETDDGLAKWREERWIAKGEWLEQKMMNGQDRQEKRRKPLEYGELFWTNTVEE